MISKKGLVVLGASLTCILAIGWGIDAYIESPSYSMSRLAKCFNERNLPCVEKYAHIVSVAEDVHSALVYHAMLCTPRSQWTPAHSLAMNVGPTSWLLVDSIRGYIERVAEAKRIKSSLFLLDDSSRYMGLHDIRRMGAVATASARMYYASLPDPIAIRFAIRKREHHWEVTNADLKSLEEALTPPHHQEIAGAFEEDNARLEREARDAQTSETLAAANPPVPLKVQPLASGATDVADQKPQIVGTINVLPRRDPKVSAVAVIVSEARRLEDSKRDATAKHFVFAIVRGSNGENRFESSRVFHEPWCPSVTQEMRAGPRSDAIAAGYTPAWDCHQPSSNH